MSETTPEGRKTTYLYDIIGQLIKATDAAGQEPEYAYDGISRILSAQDGEGSLASYAYNEAGNLAEVTDALGNAHTYTYDEEGRLLTDTYPNGEQESYTYDQKGNLLTHTDRYGVVTTYTYDAMDRLAEASDTAGNRMAYAYDLAGNLVQQTDALGRSAFYTYDKLGRPVSVKDVDGAETLYAYDDLDRLISVTDPAGGVTKYDYDQRSNLKETVDALGNTWTYGYDKLDRMTTVTDPEEKATAVVYDLVGNIESITAPGNRTIRYGYDKNYNTVSLTDPKGNLYGYTYDKDDRLIGTMDPLGQTTAYRYDKLNRPVSYTDKMGLQEAYTYDAQGNLLSRKDTGNLTTTYTYDLLNRLTSVTDPMGSTAYYQWDGMGNLTAVTDYLGRGTSYTYDLENNLTSITGPTGRKESMAYDPASRLASYTANSGKTIRYDYDKLDDLVEKAYTDATGKESAAPVEYTYDALGRRLTMTDSTGETVYAYDGLERLTSVTTYRKPAAGSNSGNTGNTWNSGAGNAWNSESSSAGSAENGGSTGSAFSHEEGSGHTIGYTYNEANDLAAITYPDGTKVSYEYDPNGNLTKVTGRRGEVTTYEYDALDRPVVEHRPNGISTYKTYNARNQITELTNQCDDCGWVLGHYVYTYDNRGYIVGEHAEEAREMDPYGRERYTPYVPEEQGENCDHGRNKTLSYRLLTTDSAFTYDDAGKLLTAMEAEAGCSTATVWTYSYDLMGNLTEKAQYKVEKGLLEEAEEAQNGGNSFSNGEEALDGTANSQKGTGDLPDESFSAQDRGNGATNNVSLPEETIKLDNSTEILEIVAKIDAISREKYAYNENNQLSEATICDGKTTKKVCYTYDEDGNLVTEYSPTDRSQTSYQYTIEDRLEVVYKGNTYNKTLQMAAAYDGDGNRVYQLNYNPEKDEDFSDYYCSYQNCDYNGTGIQLQVSGEVSQAEKDLMALINASGAVRNSSYELIEYINDVNREYTEVLVEQNINGRIDTVYTYGNERISREMFQQTSRTAYYLYDPRGSVSGLTDAKAHLTQTYRYSANGELTYGGAKYENEYTYNGESYNPNIHSQYLRARYYSVTSARFLTEDSYLGDIAEPLTLNRYNYCVSSWLNYQDPSGNITYDNLSTPADVMELWDLLTGEDTHQEFIREYRELQMEQEYYEASVLAGVLDSLISHVGRIGIGLYNTGALLGDSYRESMIQKYNSGFGRLFGEIEFEPNPMIAPDALDNYLEAQAAAAWDMNCYHAGRCGGDVVLTVAELYTLAKGIVGFVDAAAKAWSRIAGEAVSYGGVYSLAGGGTVGGGIAINWEVVRVVALEAVAEGVAEGAAAAPAIMAPHSLKDFDTNFSKINGDRDAGYGTKPKRYFRDGDLYENYIEINGHRIEALAEIEINGDKLVLKDIAIYSNEGNIPNEIGPAEFAKWLNNIKNEARAQGFKELQIIGQRAEHSTSANPGSIINHIFNLE